jgi:Zn-dependent protease
MTWTLGHLGTTRLQLNVSALLILAFLVLPGLEHGLWVRPTLLALVLVVSILVHELGHAVMADRLGLGPCRVLVHGFGGLCFFTTPPSHSQGVRVSLAGPAAGLALGGLAWAAAQVLGDDLAGPTATFLSLMIRVNLFWSLFNLLPMYPLDGGQALRHVLHLRLAPALAGRITRGLGMVLGLAVAGWGLWQQSLFLGFIGLMVVGQNRQPEEPDPLSD